ncbi:RDD family protein [Flavobacterium defluvii]|uniref:Uncharacterized membrane protein YckC, RDD family n=1 Tax=Flavobacterium defluvii TaxID=370979 RepID=A0A1M5KW39_9FLAO|nr:RDD family protein [Flavobacterium defluvii]SHG56729.1 Uncharacterized membrane protein YckC, RDD family [Flavobacterium defluvii]
MIVIFGSQIVEIGIKKGTFHCSRCNKQRNFILKQAKKYFALFFIPLLPLGKMGDSLECTTCKTLYEPNSILLNNDSVQNTLEDILPITSTGKRIGAYIIDLFLLVILNIPLAIFSKHLPEYFNTRFTLIFLPIWFLYFFLMELFFKGTLGKKMMSVISVSDNNEPISALRYFLRAVVKFIPVINIILLFTPKRKGFHDYVASTVVIEKM